MEIFDIKIQGTDGLEKTLSEIQGKANLLVIFFRGAWCGHCKKQLFELNNLVERFGLLNVQLAAVSSDTRFKSSLLKTFLKLKFPVFSDEKLVLIDSLHLRTEYKEKIVAKPAVFLFDQNKQMLYSYIGSEYDDRLSATEILKQAGKQLSN